MIVSQDRAYEIVEDMEANKVRKMKKRICLVLDCLCAHDFSDKTADLINLQHYVIKEKRLSEREAIIIFYDVVRVVEALHKVSLGWNLLKVLVIYSTSLVGCLLTSPPINIVLFINTFAHARLTRDHENEILVHR